MPSRYSELGQVSTEAAKVLHHLLLISLRCDIGLAQPRGWHLQLSHSGIAHEGPRSNGSAWSTKRCSPMAGYAS